MRHWAAVPYGYGGPGVGIRVARPGAKARAPRASCCCVGRYAVCSPDLASLRAPPCPGVVVSRRPCGLTEIGWKPICVNTSAMRGAGGRYILQSRTTPWQGAWSRRAVSLSSHAGSILPKLNRILSCISAHTLAMYALMHSLGGFLLHGASPALSFPLAPPPNHPPSRAALSSS